MPTIKLGARPKLFKRPVKFTDLDGTELLVPVHFKYRTVTEFGTYVDEYAKKVEDKMLAERAEREAQRREALDKGKAYVEPEVTNEQMRAHQAQANADYLMGILEGWDLEVPFGVDAVLQLCNETPGAASKIISDYRLAITEGHLGN